MKKAIQVSKKAWRNIIILALVVVLIATAVLINVIKKNHSLEEELAIVPPSRKLTKAEIQELATQWDTSKVDVVQDITGVPVPVPKGFMASSMDDERKVDTGFVIYKNTPSNHDKVCEDNEEDCQNQRDQYVWVPIYDPSSLYGIDTNGVMHGKLYDFTVNGRTPLNWSEVNGEMSIDFKHGSWEPQKEGLSATEVPNYLSEEAERYNKLFYGLVRSVEKYGGFYIGRYEMGNLSQSTALVVKNNSNNNSSYSSNAKKLASELDTLLVDKDGKEKVDVVTTSLLFGCQFDATLEWLVQSGNKTYSDIVNPGEWGVFKDDSHLSRVSTGSDEKTNANNIYDLAGNVAEWTYERDGDRTYWVVRGANYGPSLRRIKVCVLSSKCIRME